MKVDITDGYEALTRAIHHAKEASKLLTEGGPHARVEQLPNAAAHAATSRAWSAIAGELVYRGIQHPETSAVLR